MTTQAAFLLSKPALDRLTRGFDALSGVLGMGRVRAITRDIFTRSLSDSEVKRRLANSAVAANELAAALREPTTRSRAVAVLARMTTEAWQSPAVDERTRTAFERARDALQAADMLRYRREVANLDALAERLPSELLDCRALLLAFASRNGERLVHTLEHDSDGLAGDGESLTGEDVPSPLSDAGTSPSEAPRPAVSLSPSPALSPIPSPAPSPAPSLISTRPPPVPSPQKPPPARGPTSPFQRAVARGLTELDELQVEADRPPLAAADLAGLWRDSVDHAVARVTAATDADDAVDSLRALSIAALQAGERVEASRAAWIRAREEASRLLEERCGGLAPAAVIADAQALLGDVAAAEGELPEAELVAAFEAGGSVPQRTARARGLFERWLQGAEKQRRIEELKRQLAELQGTAVAPEPPMSPPTAQPPQAAPASEATSPASAPDVARTLAFTRASGFPQTFPRSAFLTNVKTGAARVATHILPVDPDAGVIPGQRAPSLERLNAAAAWVIRVCREEVVGGSAPLSNYLGVIDDIALVAKDNKDPATLALITVVAGLLVLGSGEYPPRARRRMADSLVACRDQAALTQVFVDTLGATSQPALAAILARLLGAGFGKETLLLTTKVCAVRPATSRGWSEALGVAFTIVPPAAREELFVTAGELAALTPAEINLLQQWLDHVGPKRTPRPLEIDHPAWLVDSLGRFADCEYETAERGDASVNVSAPARVRDAGIFIPSGSERAVLPILVRNGGQRGAAAVEVRLTATAGCTLPVDSRHAYVPWIGRDGLEPPHDAIFEVQVEIPPESQPRELKLKAYVEWNGTARGVSRDITYTVSPHPPPPSVANLPAEGVRGTPIDLTDPKVLERSSRTVRDSLAALLTALRKGEAVRAMVFGRRRRGKSSIRRTISADPAVNQQFVVCDRAWNSAPMGSVRFGLEYLGSLIRDALLSRSEEVRSFEPRDQASRDELAAAWQGWILDTSKRLRAPARVLLLLDEFQKWLSGLPDRADRQVLLDAFRAFNDASTARLDVSFVLFGLQNLQRFHRESIDFAAAVKAWPIRPFTLEESKRYVQECLPLAHDDRVRRRLHELSGGNPFVLNIFCQQLTTRANDSNRGYCLPGDVESLLEGVVDDRVEAVFAYMLREDEEENAPSLIQLTTLRAVAGRLQETGSRDGWVRIEGVEDWLNRKSVPFDPGLPKEQLQQLHELGILERHPDGQRFSLPGEAICRWLAGQDEGRVPLQPVTHRRDSNLVLNRYRQMRQLAQGGQATTWLAENVEEGGHKVVLKIYPQSDGDTREVVAREGQMLGRVRSPYVISCHSHAVDERKGGVLVLDWVDGQSLGELLRDRPAAATSILPGGQVGAQVELMKKLAAGVSAVHEARVVHKDLKPQNVMLVEASGVFVPKIIDFGVASDEPSDPATATRSAFTWRYLAPEKRRDPTLPRGRATDIYSLGVVFLDLLAGCDGEPERLLAGLPTTIPEKLRLLIADMMAEVAHARPGAQTVLSRLEGVLEPGQWHELADRAEAAYCDERPDEAIAFYERALGEAPASARHAREFAKVVGDACEILAGGGSTVQWWGALTEAGLDALASGHAPPSLAKSLFDALASNRADAGSAARWEVLLDALEGRAIATPAWVPLLEPVLGDATIARQHGDRLYEIALRFLEAGHLPSKRVADFCATTATALRRAASPTAVLETWLRRGRRVQAQPTEALASEIKAFEALLERTQAKATLPPNCDDQDRVVVGATEKGHIDVERVERFAHRLLAMHPYVCAVKRRRKDGDLAVSAPRLLEDNNIAQHRMDGIDDNCIIPFALDGSYNPQRVPIRMNIVLPKGTTAAQRKVARDAIAANTQLFP